MHPRPDVHRAPLAGGTVGGSREREVSPDVSGHRPRPVVLRDGGEFLFTVP